MYSHLRIHNFRGFKDLDLADLQRINLFSGRNNTGKSAILEAVFLLCSGPLAGANILGAVRGFRGEAPVPPETSRDSTPWDNVFFGFNFEAPVVVNGRRKGVEYSVELVRQDPDQGSSQLGVPGARRVQVNFREAGTLHRYTQELAFQLTPGGSTQIAPGVQQQSITAQTRIDPPGNAFEQAFLIGSRLRASQPELADRYSQLRKRGAEGDLIQALQVIEPRLRRLEVLVESGVPTLYFDLKNAATAYPLSVMGEGVASVIDFITSIQQARGGIVLIDEIENGLHYSTLQNIWWHLHRAAERADVQIFATTHSRECVNAARLALDKRPNEINFVRLRQAGVSNSVEPVQYDSEALAGALDGGLDIR